jgi:hypothetical protein
LKIIPNGRNIDTWRKFFIIKFKNGLVINEKCINQNNLNFKIILNGVYAPTGEWYRIL